MEKINLGWVIEQAIAINAPKANLFSAWSRCVTD
jgi:hypothetical protein